MVKKAISLFLAAGLALVGIPLGAAQGLPSSISGKVPAGKKDVVSATLQGRDGKSLSTVPVTSGTFLFRDLTAGEYYVELFSASGKRVDRSCRVDLAAATQKEASFGCGSAAAWILIGAAAAGITTAVVIATNKDEGPASPIR